MCDSNTNLFELKEEKWARKKENSTLLADSLFRLRMDKMAERVSDCGSYLVFAQCPNDHERRLRKAYFCKSRLCSMCIWRKSLATYHQAYQMCHHALQKQPDLSFIFLTLTIRNVEGEELRDSITQLTEGFHRLMMLRGWKRHIAGFMRSIEITRNKKKRSKDYGTYHPHIHVILAVYPSYFESGYKTKKQVAQLWKDSVRIDYDPVIDIRKVKPKKRKQFDDWDDEMAEVKKPEHDPLIAGAVAEVSKYSVSENSFIDKEDEEWTDTSVAVLLASLHRKRLIAYGGILRDIRKELNMKDVDVDADLVNVTGEEKTCTCSVCQSDFLDIAYSWLGDKYVGKKYDTYERDEEIHRSANKRRKNRKQAEDASAKVSAWKTTGASSSLKTKKLNEQDFDFGNSVVADRRDREQMAKDLERVRESNSKFSWEEHHAQKEKEWSTPGAHETLWRYLN